MTDAVKSYVITYTENKQHHEVVWHALSVEDALWSMEASYIDPADFQKVSNIEVYEVISVARIAALTLAVGEGLEREKKLREFISLDVRNATEYDLTSSFNGDTCDCLSCRAGKLLAETAPATEAGK